MAIRFSLPIYDLASFGVHPEQYPGLMLHLKLILPEVNCFSSDWSNAWVKVKTKLRFASHWTGSQQVKEPLQTPGQQTAKPLVDSTAAIVTLQQRLQGRA